MELLMLVFMIVGASRWAKKHDRTLLTKEEYDDLWRKSPYADVDEERVEQIYLSLITPEKDDSLRR